MTTDTQKSCITKSFEVGKKTVYEVLEGCECILCGSKIMLLVEGVFNLETDNIVEQLFDVKLPSSWECFCSGCGLMYYPDDNMQAGKITEPVDSSSEDE